MGKEEQLDLVYEPFQCPTKSVVMSALETLSIFGMCTDASVKDNVLALTSKIEKLSTKYCQPKKIADCFTLL